MMQSLSFFLSEALIGMRRSSLMTLLAIAIIAVSLLIFGIFMLLTANINNVTNYMTDKLEVRVFLKSTVSDADMKELRDKFSQRKEVKSALIIDKKTAWKNFQENYQNIELGDMLNSNPLPNAIQIRLKDNRYLKIVATYLESFKLYIDEVDYGDVISERIHIFSRYTKIGGIFLVVLLSLATLLIIVNTIRLTIIARQDEIYIMQLVGATKSFIRWPFIIEGLMMGLIGALIAVFVLKNMYAFIGAKIQDAIPFFPLVLNSGHLRLIYLAIGGSGAFIGIFGAYLSVSRSFNQNIKTK